VAPIAKAKVNFHERAEKDSKRAALAAVYRPSSATAYQRPSTVTNPPSSSAPNTFHSASAYLRDATRDLGTFHARDHQITRNWTDRRLKRNGVSSDFVRCIEQFRAAKLYKTCTEGVISDVRGSITSTRELQPSADKKVSEYLRNGRPNETPIDSSSQTRQHAPVIISTRTVAPLSTAKRPPTGESDASDR